MEEKKEIKTQTEEKATPAKGGRTVRMVRGGRRGPRGAGKDGADKKGGPRSRGPRRGDKPRSEFDNKLLDIRRVTRVMAGGRRFSFAASVVVGDKKGRVGVGTGKSSDTPLAIEKAIRDAQKKLVRVPLTKDGSIPHDVQAKYASATVSLIPTKSKSVTAGSAVRIVLELAGVKAVTGKILSRSKNKMNIARATVKALSSGIKK